MKQNHNNVLLYFSQNQTTVVPRKNFGKLEISGKNGSADISASLFHFFQYLRIVLIYLFI